MLWGVLLVLLIFSCYIYTLSPTVTFSDSGDFITCAYTLGLPHPMGYPTYILTAKLFTCLPFGNIGYKVNLFSAIAAALSCLTLYYILQRLFKDTLISFSVSALFGLSAALWWTAVVSEVYALYAFFCNLLILLLIEYIYTKEVKLIYLGGFVFGVSLTNHTLTAMLLPALIAAVVIATPKKIQVIKNLSWAIVFALLGFSVVLSLVILGLKEPLIDWGHPLTLKDFIRYISSAIYYEEYFTETTAKFLYNFKEFIKILWQQFHYLWIFILPGAYLIWKNKKLSLIFCIIFAAFGYVLSVSAKIIPGVIDYHAYYLPLYSILCILLSYTLVWLKGLFKPLRYIFLLLPLSIFFINLKENNQRYSFFAYDYGRNVLQQLPQNSIFFNEVDYNVFPFWYLQYVEERRPDVATFTLLFLTRPWYTERLLKHYPHVKLSCPYNLHYGKIFSHIVKENIDKHCIYYTFNEPKEKKEKIEVPFKEYLTKEGLLYRVKGDNLIKEFRYNYRYIFDEKVYKDVWAQEVMLVYGYYHADLGQRLLLRKDFKRAIEHLELACKFDSENSSYLSVLGMAYVECGDVSYGRQLIEKAIAKMPQPQYYYSLAYACYKQRDFQTAVSALKKALKLNPHMTEAIKLLQHIKNEGL